MCKYTDQLTRRIHILPAEIQVHFYFGTQRLYTLEEIFDWEMQGSWNEFWLQGVKTTGEELEFYELLMRAKIDEEPTAVAASSSTASTSVETSNEA
jgi:hypothetical protein